MKIYEIGTGYTSIPPRVSAATETVVEELSHSLIKLGADVTVLDIADPHRKNFNLPLVEVPLPSWLLNCDPTLGLYHKVKRVLYSVSLTRTLHTLLRKETDEIILHFHNQYNQFFFQLLTPKKLLKQVKIAYTNHNGHWSRPWNEVSSMMKKKYFQEIHCMKHADMVFVLNPLMKENLLMNLGVQENQLFLIGNGVNTERYYPLSESERKQCRQYWDLSEHRLILQVGSVNRNKGQKRSLEQLLVQLKSDKNLLFGYAGGIVDEAYHQDLLNFAKKEGIENQLRYFGMIPPGKELNSLYNCAEAVIHASDYEAFSLVLLEAMAAGAPLILCGTSKEMLQEPLKYSLSLTDNKERHHLIQEVYSWDAVARQYFTVFQSIGKEC